jgi:hypothetical protein
MKIPTNHSSAQEKKDTNRASSLVLSIPVLSEIEGVEGIEHRVSPVRDGQVQSIEYRASSRSS